MVDGTLERKVGQSDALQDLAVLRNFVGGAGVLTLFDSPWVPLYLAVVYLLSPLLGHVALAGGAILFGLALVNDLVTHNGVKLATGYARRARYGVDSAIRNAEAIDAMGLTDNIARRWSTAGWQALRLPTPPGGRTSVVKGAWKFVRLFLQIAVWVLGAPKLG